MRTISPNCFTDCLAVLIKLLIPFSIPFPFSIYNLLDGNESEEFQAITANEFQYYNNVVPFDAITASTPSDETQNSIYMNLLRVIMLSGSVIIMVFIFINHLIYRRKYALSLPCADDYIIEWVDTHKIRRKYSVRVLDIIKSPITYGVIRPVILLPSCINVDEKQMELILMHEYTHIKRFDVLWKVSYIIMVAVHWFNPIVWLAYIFMNKDLELSCDEAVINSMGYACKKRYAETLVDLAYVKK
ncbi:MAG: M56 family metallopeptidase [Erysipelotrichaceae bacterium]|nr:M56 family metallopeptidase [Erysipelotrichaceae bacterium]